MPTVDASLKAFSAFAALAFGLLVLAANPRKTANRALGLFLLLIAGNQAAEAVRTLFTDPVDLLVWRRVASVFAALDPIALYYFASIYPERNRLNSGWRLGLVVGVGGAFALAGGWLLPQGEPPGARASHVFALALAAYTGVVYLVVADRVLEGLVREPASPWWRLLFAAACVAAFEPVAYVGEELLFLLPFPSSGAGFLLLTLLALGACSVAPLWMARRARRKRPSPEAARGIRLGLAVGLLALLGWVCVTLVAAQLHRIAHPLGPAFEILGRTLVSIRWLLFGLLVSTAILRHDPFGMSLRARRRAARALVALLFLGLGLQVAQVALGQEDVPAWALLAIGTAVVLSQGFRAFVDQVAWRVYGVPMREDPAGRVEAYRLAVARALAEGRPPEDPSLARLRDELGLDPVVAEIVVEAAEAHRGPLETGQVLGRRYRLVRVLGRGAGGRAFLARDERLARDVVLKEIPVGAPEAVEHALREARLAGGIGHPNVLTVHDVLVRPEAVVLVAEHAPGGSLAERLRERGAPDQEEALRILRGVLRGLAEIHARGIVHRDLQPSNVLFARDGTPKVADFGLARLRGAQTTRSGVAWTVGEGPAPFAPEQRRGGPATFQTDVHAVGVLARLLMPQGAPQGVEEVIQRALRGSPEARWPDAGEMLAALESATQDAR